MTNVVTIIPSAADKLRSIADDMDAGVFSPQGVTIITLPHVFYVGDGVPDQVASANTVFDCQWAIHKLMKTCHDR